MRLYCDRCAWPLMSRQSIRLKRPAAALSKNLIAHPASHLAATKKMQAVYSLWAYADSFMRFLRHGLSRW